MESSNSCLHEQLRQAALGLQVWPGKGRLFLNNPTPVMREGQETEVRKMVMLTRMDLSLWL